ncbi:cyclin-domain-containing protein [Mycotypha africana]|uniref:cyclin-domain-containing protein n=1 Tax=Mycotypha africana TaxID=64632 RepID=UPI002300848B|nr:cyclin-domain-containing protein [Mycotypha africana]KAI8979463.1 cyclin-domain-containing protein [Mycotypha africana]
MTVSTTYAFSSSLPKTPISTTMTTPACFSSILSVTSTSQLAEFCAMIVPCIWARSFKQKSLLSPKRHAAFKLYVQKVLKATQISCTCLLLALYYVQKLRAAYPSIHASIGSEVRLFTTALVLANKFLDDNTFTNKTWSEVSSIPINELNIMEMEFLSALQYNIHVSSSTYFAWTSQCQLWWTSHLMQPTMQTGSVPPQVLVLPPHHHYPPYPSQQQQQQQQQQPATSLKRSFEASFSSDTIDKSDAKKRHVDTSYYPYPTPPLPPLCKPILSWSSTTLLTGNITPTTTTTMNTYHQQTIPATITDHQVFMPTPQSYNTIHPDIFYNSLSSAIITPSTIYTTQ